MSHQLAAWASYSVTSKLASADAPPPLPARMGRRPPVLALLVALSRAPLMDPAAALNSIAYSALREYVRPPGRRSQGSAGAQNLVPWPRYFLVGTIRINVTATLLECGRTPQR